MEEQQKQVNNITTETNQQPMEREQKTKSKGISIKTFLLIILLAVAAFGLAGYAILKPQLQSQVVTQIPTATPIPNPIQTSLTVSSTPIKLSTPSAYSTDIIINTGQDMVNKVQLELSYDPKILSKVDVTTGSFFSNPQILLKNIDPINGRISFAIGVQDGNTGQIGQGIVAKLMFTETQKNATTSVTLLPKSEVSADGISQSVLKTSINGLFDFRIINLTSTKSAE